MTTNELKPCPAPWCAHSHATIQRPNRYYHAECMRCGCQGPSCGTEAEAIAAWNQRIPDPALTAERDRLAGEVAKLFCASGCSCCRDDEVWHAASNALAELLGIPKYADNSGHDWFSVRDAYVALTQGAA